MKKKNSSFLQCSATVIKSALIPWLPRVLHVEAQLAVGPHHQAEGLVEPAVAAAAVEHRLGRLVQLRGVRLKVQSQLRLLWLSGVQSRPDLVVKERPVVQGDDESCRFDLCQRGFVGDGGQGRPGLKVLGPELGPLCPVGGGHHGQDLLAVVGLGRVVEYSLKLSLGIETNSISVVGLLRWSHSSHICSSVGWSSRPLE